MGKRSLLGLDLICEIDDSAESSIITSSEHDTTAPSVSTFSTSESDVGRLKNVLMGFLGHSEKLFGHTGEGSVVDLHFVGLEKDEIGGHKVTTMDHDDIAGHKGRCRNFSCTSIALDSTGFGGKVLEIVHEGRGLG